MMNSRILGPRILIYHVQCGGVGSRLKDVGLGFQGSGFQCLGFQGEGFLGFTVLECLRVKGLRVSGFWGLGNLR